MIFGFNYLKLIYLFIIEIVLKNYERRKRRLGSPLPKISVIHTSLAIFIYKLGSNGRLATRLNLRFVNKNIKNNFLAAMQPALCCQTVPKEHNTILKK
jgi:hypothetical protein